MSKNPKINISYNIIIDSEPKLIEKYQKNYDLDLGNNF